MCLVALRQVGHRHLLLQRLQSDLRPPSRIDLPSRLAHGPPRPSMTERLALQLIRLSQIPIHFSVILARLVATRSEEHTSELQSLMRISYAVFCLKKKHHT